MASEMRFHLQLPLVDMRFLVLIQLGFRTELVLAKLASKRTIRVRFHVNLQIFWRRESFLV